jgi:hypothetical protein
MHYKFVQQCTIHKLNRWVIFDNQKAEVLQEFFCCTSFLKGSFQPKNYDIALLDTLGFFFNIYFSNTSLARLLLPPQTFLQSQHGLHLHIFSRLSFCWFYDMIKLDTSIGLL